MQVSRSSGSSSRNVIAFDCRETNGCVDGLTPKEATVCPEILFPFHRTSTCAVTMTLGMFYLLGISNTCVPGHLARRSQPPLVAIPCASSLGYFGTDRSPSGFIIGASETNRLIEIFYRTLDVPSSHHHPPRRQRQADDVRP